MEMVSSCSELFHEHIKPSSMDFLPKSCFNMHLIGVLLILKSKPFCLQWPVFPTLIMHLSSITQHVHHTRAKGRIWVRASVLSVHVEWKDDHEVKALIKFQEISVQFLTFSPHASSYETPMDFRSSSFMSG